MGGVRVDTKMHSVNFEEADLQRSLIDSECRAFFSKRKSETPLLNLRGLPVSKLLHKVQLQEEELLSHGADRCLLNRVTLGVQEGYYFSSPLEKSSL